MVSVGSNVATTEYNNYVSRVNTILGIGSGKTGYGVAMANTGQAVAGTTEISAAQWAGLRTDINLIYSHQSNTTTGVGEIVSGNIIGADTSNTSAGNTVIRDGSDNFSIVNPANNKGVNDFAGLLDSVEVDPETVVASYLSVESKISPATSGAIYTPSWSSSISGVVLVTFAGGYNCKNNAGATIAATNDDHRRHFFNTGGEIRLSSTMIPGYSGTKSADWATMLSNTGTITLKNSSTTTTGTASINSGFGNEDLTTSYQQVSRKFGSDSLYAENNFTINAKLDGSGNILFQFVWSDADVGDPGTDEPVNGDIGMIVDQVRCTGGPIAIQDPVYSMSQNIQ
jgi:hypothetical protein